jgi:hypothetical protein
MRKYFDLKVELTILAHSEEEAREILRTFWESTAAKPEADYISSKFDIISIKESPEE